MARDEGCLGCVVKKVWTEEVRLLPFDSFWLPRITSIHGLSSVFGDAVVSVEKIRKC